MRCQECLAELATGSLRNLTPESAVAQHCATCPDCGPLATMLRDREYNAATVLNNLPPMSNPISVAENAALVARRRRLGKVAVYITGGALVATIWLSVFLTGIGRNITGDQPSVSSIRTETIQLSCLSAQQAGDIVEPYLRSRSSRYFVGNSGLKVITVRGTADELAKSRELIRTFESDPQAACRHTPADVVNEMLKRFGPPQGSGPDVAPKSEAAPKPDGAPSTDKK